MSIESLLNILVVNAPRIIKTIYNFIIVVGTFYKC